eukprot:scaffold1642_cov252-Pinguiococcus_pyrenoidosus.AAC.30
MPHKHANEMRQVSERWPPHRHVYSPKPSSLPAADRSIDSAGRACCDWRPVGRPAVSRAPRA